MDEYIEKDEAVAIIENKQREICPMGLYSRHAVYGSDREAFDNWQEILDKIEAIQPADVASVRHGRWIEPFLSDSGNMCAECSNCHRIRIFDDYCSACGAIMDLNDLED